MLHSIKPQPNDFNLLYLSDIEKLISTVKCSYFNTSTHKIEKGYLHLNTRSLAIQPSELSLPLIQTKFSEMQLFKSFTIEDLILLLSKSLQDTSLSKENSGYLFKGLIKKSTFGGNPQTNNNKYLNLLTVYSNSNPQQQDKGRKSYINTGSSNHLPGNGANSKRLNESNNNSKEITNNSQVNTSSFNYKLGTISEAMNKILNEKGKDSYTNKGIHSSYTFNHNEIKSKSPLVITDILLYLNDCGFNMSSFYDLMKNIKENYHSSNIKFNFLLITVNKSTSIYRANPSMYEISLMPKSYLVIVEGDSNQIMTLNEDRKYIVESLHKTLFDDTKELNLLLQKKLNELFEDLYHIFSHGEIVKLYKANRILPEGIQHGLLIIRKNESNDYIEFYSAVNNYKNKPLKILLSRIEAIVPYRHLFKLNGINIFIYQSQRSKVFSLEGEDNAKELGDFLTQHCPNIDKTFNNLEYHTDLWVKGLMTNYDYLLYLNTKASRTFNDLSQYPVFPWVIAKYDDVDEFDVSDEKNYRDLSKAIGAINPEKLAKFTEKYLNDKTNYSSREPLYLYPLHYSSPMIVIFFLNRKLPRLQLQMQGGSFDNRMLISMKGLWDYLYAEGNDVMELIPEFYNSDGEFLINIYNAQYGRLKNTKMINDVVLPKWAKSPKDFIRINRAALESEYVSNNLHHWIDLIFGYKQRGEMAEMHENLFRPNTYDNYNYDDFTDAKKNAEVANITLSGQTPRLLFRGPHPKKRNMDMLNYELQLNPQEVILQKYKKDNEKLENDYKDKLHDKYEENLGIIKDNKELERKRTEKIEKMKEEYKIKEQHYKEIIDKMIEQNNQLKKNFDEYDQTKDQYVNEVISNIEESHRNTLEENYSSPEKVFAYIQSLEKQINRYKVREKDYKERIAEKTKQIEKAEKINQNLKQTIQKLDNKISIANGLYNKYDKK